MIKPRVTFLAALGALALILNLGIMPGTADAHTVVTVTSRGTTSVPNLDGILTAGEWSGADTLPFTIHSITGTIGTGVFFEGTDSIYVVKG